MAQSNDMRKGTQSESQPADPPTPPPKLVAFALVTVSVASIVYIINTLFHLFSCSVKC